MGLNKDLSSVLSPLKLVSKLQTNDGGIIITLSELRSVAKVRVTKNEPNYSADINKGTSAAAAWCSGTGRSSFKEKTALTRIITTL